MDNTYGFYGFAWPLNPSKPLPKPSRYINTHRALLYWLRFVRFRTGG
jgi:hypothetical protein